LIDLIYSEFSEDILDISQNEERDVNKLGFISKYGKERIAKFLNDNNLQLMVTSHSWITEGVKAYNKERIIIIYSSSNYMDKAGNIAGILNVTKNCNQVVPKLLDSFKTDKKFYKKSATSQLSPIRYRK